MVLMSIGLRDAILTQYGLADMMNFGVIDCYTGGQPDSPDRPSTGTWLGSITTNGDTFQPGVKTAGLELDKSSRARLKDKGNWVFTAHNAGTIGWWRWRWNSVDTDEFSAFYPRVDGLADESLILKSYSVAKGDTVGIQQFLLRF